MKQTLQRKLYYLYFQFYGMEKMRSSFDSPFKHLISFRQLLLRLWICDQSGCQGCIEKFVLASSGSPATEILAVRRQNTQLRKMESKSLIM